MDNATRGSLNTCTLYPPCSNPFPKLKVISGSSSHHLQSISFWEPLAFPLHFFQSYCERVHNAKRK
ncbi:MAG TPA: hypothetical protein VE524_09450 [Nitrososphaeraceae archaeon]|nr:hypothetical protein [Nitrososphaeraceae archaeon]